MSVALSSTRPRWRLRWSSPSRPWVLPMRDMPIKAAPVAAPSPGQRQLDFVRLLPGSTDPGVYSATYNARYQFDLAPFDVNGWAPTSSTSTIGGTATRTRSRPCTGPRNRRSRRPGARTLSGNAFLGKGFSPTTSPRTSRSPMGPVRHHRQLPGAARSSVRPRRPVHPEPAGTSTCRPMPEETHNNTYNADCFPATFDHSSDGSARTGRTSPPARTPATRSQDRRRASNW